MYQHILYSVEAPVATITMNRPDNLNAFTTRMLAEIRHALAEAERDERVVGIVLTGAGRGFCAGMDMNALNDMSSGAGRVADDLSALDAHPGDRKLGENFDVAYTYLLSIRKPLLAAINGACAGLGFCVALLCDMRFVDKTAKFTTAFSQRGLVAEHGASWILPRLIGPGRALDLLWSARKFDGIEARELGIAERLCEPGTAATEASNYIKQLAQSAAPMSLMVMKQQVYKHLNMQLGESMRDSNKLMAESLKRDDFKEGVRSFMERRPPNFKRLQVAAPAKTRDTRAKQAKKQAKTPAKTRAKTGAKARARKKA
ncbi:MAG TPA: enoyl-CoA hydratase-related protein [Pseudomonadales bacterium]|nr:enoyl-CoA hydratase-related protein [Pseudomonadales bacterium]